MSPDDVCANRPIGKKRAWSLMDLVESEVKLAA
jgi:hypothetical protein